MNKDYTIRNLEEGKLAFVVRLNGEIYGEQVDLTSLSTGKPMTPEQRSDLIRSVVTEIIDKIPLLTKKNDE